MEGNHDEAGYVFFFERFLTELEKTTRSLDERVVEESPDLLVIATCRIFSNLTWLHPSIDLSCPAALNARMRKVAEAYAKKFDQVEVEEDKDDGEEDVADGEGTS